MFLSFHWDIDIERETGSERERENVSTDMNVNLNLKMATAPVSSWQSVSGLFPLQDRIFRLPYWVTKGHCWGHRSGHLENVVGNTSYCSNGLTSVAIMEVKPFICKQRRICVNNLVQWFSTAMWAWLPQTETFNSKPHWQAFVLHFPSATKQKGTGAQ